MLLKYLIGICYMEENEIFLGGDSGHRKFT